MPNRIRLREGELVAYGGEKWVIVHIEDTARVLASRTRDRRHEFLAIADLCPPVAPPDKESVPEANMPDIELVIDEPELSPHLKRLKRRRVRSLPAEEMMTRKERERLDRAVDEFHDAQNVIKAPRRERRALVADMCKKFHYKESTAYRRIQIAEAYGTADALMRALHKRSGSSSLSEQVRDAIRDQLERHRFIKEPKTLPDVLELLNGHLREHHNTEISLSTLWKFEQETPLKKKLEAQGRKKKAADAFRPKVGHLPNNDYPLSIAQVDHTPMQVCLVDDADRRPIGDAWLSLVIDTYSRMVLGFYLTFEAPSTLSTGLALAHAFLPKEDYLRSQNVTGEWPCWGFPDVILVDNAVELNGHMMHGARRRYRFILRDRPLDAPNFGGHVESAFRTFMYEFKSIPGTKFSNPVERGEYDSEGHAIFTIGEFEAFFTEFLVNDYHLAKHTGEGMDGSVPYLKWKQGIFEGDIMPPVGLPDRPTDSLSLRISLMPIERRTVRNGIVNLFDEEYHSGALTLISDDVNLTKPLKDRKFEVRYDPRDISKIWFYDEAAEHYIELTFADLRKGSISLWEHRARKRRRGDPSEQFKEQRYESKLRREDMKESAAKRTKQQRLEAEKARHRASGALVQAPNLPKRTPSASTKKAALDPAARERLRMKVREAAPVAPDNKETSDDV